MTAPLQTLHTRLMNLLNEARFVRQKAGEYAERLQAGNVSANAVVGLAQRFHACITNVVEPEEGKEDIDAYAAVQFADPEFGLQTRLTGIKALVQAVIDEAITCVPTDSDGYLLYHSWAGGGAVSVRQLTPQDTASLVSALVALRNAIPE